MGPYPETGLRDAREKRDGARKLIAAGTDPRKARKADKVERARKRESQVLAAAGASLPCKFEHVARDWLTTIHEGMTTRGLPSCSRRRN